MTYSAKMIAVISGIGLLSDGYVNNSIGSVITLLKKIYPQETASSVAFQNLASCAFVGVVVGQLSFGWVSDRFGRKFGMIMATLILIAFTLACAFSYMPDVGGMLIMLTVFRTFLGVGIGAEYPTASVSASESAGETKGNHRHGLFIAVTNCAINFGFILSGFVAYVLVVCLPDNLNLVWRLTIGLGSIIPCSILYFRLQIGEPDAVVRAAEKHKDEKNPIPLMLVARHYGLRLFAISFVWFVYDFSSYAFSLYSSTITASVLPKSAPLATVFGWDVLILCFYLPGAILGAPFTDKFGPKFALLTGLIMQAVFGLFLAGFYTSISSNIGLFSIMYGIFISWGELGPGNNIGVLASSSSATVVRGRFYGIAAAAGKVGAYVGTYAFPIMQKSFGHGDPDSADGQRGPFMIASVLNIVAALVAWMMISEISQNCVREEDEAFEVFLEENHQNDTAYHGGATKKFVGL